MKRIAVGLVALTLAAGSLLAQDPTPRQPRVPEALVAYLQLTEAQLQSLAESRTALHENIRTIHEQIRQKQTLIREEMQKENPNAGLVGQYMVESKQLQEQVKTKREEATNAWKAGLNDGQRAALANLTEVAKLQPVIRQAAALNLIDLPEGEGRPGKHGKSGMRGRPQPPRPPDAPRGIGPRGPAGR